MSVYQGKLLELLSIDREFDRALLRVRLSFEQEVELFWEIDNDTADNLKEITAFGENYKYRLSFHHYWDSNTMQHIGFITRTILDESERIYFSCSAEFIKALDSIKSINQISMMPTLPFLSINLPNRKLELEKELELELELDLERKLELDLEREQKIDIEREKEEEAVKSRRYYNRLAWVAVLIICMTSTILLGYSSHSYIDTTAFAQKTTQITESKKRKTGVKQEEKEKTADNEQAASVSSNQPTTPSVELNKVMSYSIPDGNVALTFDDGPSKYTMEIIDILKKYQVGGSFFFIGYNVKKYPENVQYVNSNGYSIGSHSMSHLNFTNLSYEKQENDLLQTNQLIKEIIHKPVILFRPPFGAKNDATISLMKKQHTKMVLWNKDTEDWKNRNSREIIDYVHSSKTSGSIILLHESPAVIDALPKVIEYLQGQKLKIVSLK